MKKVSLIATSRGIPDDLPRSVSEVASFTQKFPVAWEIIVVADPPFPKEVPVFQNQENFHVKILQNDKHLGRGRSLLRAMRESTGDVIITFSLDSTIPLAEIFQFLQELTVDPKLDLIIGNRYTSRKKMLSLRSPWHQTLEKIVKEKWEQKGPLTLSDPLTAYFGIRQSAFAPIRDQIQFSSWYYMPELLRWASKQKWKIHEAPILSKDQKPSQIPLVKEFFRAAFLP